MTGLLFLSLPNVQTKKQIFGLTALQIAWWYHLVLVVVIVGVVVGGTDKNSSPQLLLIRSN